MGRKNKLFWVFLVIFIGAIAFAGGYYYNQQKKEAVYKEMAKQNEKNKQEEPPKQEAPVQEETPAEVPEPVEIPVDFAELQKTNPEIYAWIRIPDTEIDYPIVQRPEDDAYYLNHTIEGAEGLPGSIFTESLNQKDFSDRNTVIYGHDMRDGTMFGHLKHFMDSEYMGAHPQVFIYTPEHIFTYEIFAAVTYGNRHIMKTFDFSQDEQYQDFLNSLTETRNMSSYVRDDVQISMDKKIITLSTCNGNSDERFLVEAVLIDEK